MNQYYTRCKDNNRQMKLYSPGCMEINKQMKLYYTVCIENNKQMDLYSVCMENNKQINLYYPNTDSFVCYCVRQNSIIWNCVLLCNISNEKP
jgi:hypothetical protein